MVTTSDKQFTSFNGYKMVEMNDFQFANFLNGKGWHGEISVKGNFTGFLVGREIIAICEYDNTACTRKTWVKHP